MNTRDEDPTAAGEPLPPNWVGAEKALVQQLIVSLTALGNYLAAAHQKVVLRPEPGDDLLAMALGRASRQFDQASTLARRLHHLVPPMEDTAAAEGAMAARSNRAGSAKQSDDAGAAHPGCSPPPVRRASLT